MTVRAVAHSLLFALLLFAGAAIATNRSASAGSALQVLVEPGAGAGPLLSLINHARRTVRLEVYMLTDTYTLRALGRARSRGVDVRVLLEEHPYGYGDVASTANAALRSEGVAVRWANESAFTYTHAKVLEVDDRFAAICTCNFTRSGFFRNREFALIDRSPYDARAIGAIFTADWNRRPARWSDPSLVVSPTNARRDLYSLIAGARRSLDVYAEEVNDPGIESRLVRARAHGVRVRLITSASSAGVDTLSAGRVGVTIMADPYVHAKIVVADGRRFFLGSENLSSTSLDRNREVGIELDNAALARVLEGQFALDWRGNTTSAVPSPPVTGSGTLRLQVAAQPDRVARGQLLTISARTAAGANCGIRVVYPDGYVSRAYSLRGQHTADSSGLASWSWHVGSTVTGTAHATVSCTDGSRSGSATVAFVIT